MRALPAAALALAALVPQPAPAGGAPADATDVPAFPYTVCNSVSFDPPESVILGFRCAGSQDLADHLNAGPPHAPVATFAICHGEMATTCAMFPGYAVLEQCTNANGIGTALPMSSARRLCPDPDAYDVTVDVPGMAGDNCGYAWFHLNCD